MKDLAVWLKGFGVAVLSGAIAGATGSVVAPESINTKDGRAALATVAAIGATKGAYLYLTSSPRYKRKGNEERRKR